ncbi:MAG: hypothetical protein K0Q97_2589 [Bacillota bacterium]|nr:hypothetical protein [Bacillota bacterium]
MDTSYFFIAMLNNNITNKINLLNIINKLNILNSENDEFRKIIY